MIGSLYLVLESVKVECEDSVFLVYKNILGSEVKIVGNREESEAKFKLLAVDSNLFSSIQSKTAKSLNICAFQCR